MQSEKLQLEERVKIAAGRKQIFLVDDDESVRRALSLLLLSCEFQVKAFGSTEEFFSAVPNSAPGCLILDIHLPGLDGWEALRRLNKSGSKRPVIIASADKEDGLMDRASKAGVSGVLQKPVNGQELVLLINKVYLQAANSVGVPDLRKQ